MRSLFKTIVLIVLCCLFVGAFAGFVLIKMIELWGKN